MKNEVVDLHKLVKMLIENTEDCSIKFRHCSFDDEEWLISKSDGNIYDEQGYLFEDWDTPNMFNGMRMRKGGAWEDGWVILDIIKPSVGKADNLHRAIRGMINL